MSPSVGLERIRVRVNTSIRGALSESIWQDVGRTKTSREDEIGHSGKMAPMVLLLALALGGCYGWQVLCLACGVLGFKEERREGSEVSAPNQMRKCTFFLSQANTTTTSTSTSTSTVYVCNVNVTNNTQKNRGATLQEEISTKI